MDIYRIESMNNKPSFQSVLCRSGHHCHACRSYPAWRESAAKHYDMGVIVVTGSSFDCPQGKTSVNSEKSGCKNCGMAWERKE